MRRKWVILAAVVFLGIAGWCVLRGSQAGYPAEAVSAVLIDNGASSFVITESRIDMPVFRKRADPLGLRKAISWIKYDLLGIDPFADFSNRTDPVFFSTDGTGFTSIHLSENNGRIHEVVIHPATEASEVALGIQAKLLKEFPRLRSKIETSQP